MNFVYQKLREAENKETQTHVNQSGNGPMNFKVSIEDEQQITCPNEAKIEDVSKLNLK